MLYTSPHLPNVRVNSHVFFFRRKFWTSKVTYLGSAADFWVVCVNPGFIFFTLTFDLLMKQWREFKAAVEFWQPQNIGAVSACSSARSVQT